MKVAEETGMSEEYVKENEQKRDVLAAFNNGYYFENNNSDELFIKESELIKKVGTKEACVIVGRCADYILNNKKNVLKVFIYNSEEDKIKRATKYYGMNKKNAEKEIEKINKLRANHYKYYTGREWRNFENYDLCINSDKIGVEKAAELIVETINSKQKVEVTN